VRATGRRSTPQRDATGYLLQALREKVRSEWLTDSMQVNAALRLLLADFLQPLEKALMLPTRNTTNSFCSKRFQLPGVARVHSNIMPWDIKFDAVLPTRTDTTLVKNILASPIHARGLPTDLSGHRTTPK